MNKIAPASYLTLSRSIYDKLSKSFAEMPVFSSKWSTRVKENQVENKINASSVEEITKTLMGSNLFSTRDMESNLWLFTKDPEDIAIKTQRIKQLMTLNDINHNQTPPWFIHSLYAFDTRKISRLMSDYAKDSKSTNAQNERHFIERVRYLSDLFKISTFGVVAKIESFPFLISLSETDLLMRYQILKNEAKFEDADILQRMQILSSTSQLLRQRIQLFNDKGIKFKPYMFRLSMTRISKLFEALENSKNVLNGAPDIITYISNRLKISKEDVLIMAAKGTRTNLLATHPDKIQKMIDLLISEGYKEEEIATAGSRVFEYSVPEVAYRIKRCKDATGQRPLFSYFRLGKEAFEEKLQRKVDDSQTMPIKMVKKTPRNKMNDVLKIKSNLRYKTNET